MTDFSPIPTSGGANRGPTVSAEDLRQAKRAARSEIGPEEQHGAAIALSDRLLGLASVSDATTVAVYRAVRGEISLDPTIAALRSAGVTAAYPLVPSESERRTLTFHAIASDSELQPGALGIPAPTAAAPVVASIDVVLVPLVAFDDQCNRLGMGGGYYDATFAPGASSDPRPILIGVAHDCQRVSRLTTKPWDVALDAVATPTMLLVREPDRLARRT